MAATLFTDHFDNQDTSKNDSLYTKTGLVFGFTPSERPDGRAGPSPPEQLVGLANGFIRAGSYPRTKGAEDFTHLKIVFGFYPKTILR
jgi:hypothetical protein